MPSAREVLVDSNVQWSNYGQDAVPAARPLLRRPGAGGARPLGEVAAMHASDGIARHRWWTLAELDATAEDVYPPGWRTWSGRWPDGRSGPGAPPARRRTGCALTVPTPVTRS